MKNVIFIVLLFLLSGCSSVLENRNGQLHLDRLRHIELKEKFGVSEWSVEISANAMMYFYGKSEDSPSEVQGGMGVSPQDTTIYIWGNWGSGQMSLSASSPSCVFWPTDYGLHFHPVYTADKLVVGSKICLMRGYGPSAGKSLWIKIVPREVQTKLERAHFVGVFRSNSCEGRVISKDDGTWEAVDDAYNFRMSGTWCLRGKSMVTTFDHLSKNFQDVTPILSANENEHVLLEMDGSMTTFTKIVE